MYQANIIEKISSFINKLNSLYQVIGFASLKMSMEHC